jgi:hypothetical protein
MGDSMLRILDAGDRDRNTIARLTKERAALRDRLARVEERGRELRKATQAMRDARNLEVEIGQSWRTDRAGTGTNGGIATVRRDG